MIEIIWHNVRAIECKTIQCLDQITKGSKIYILGRLLSRRYTDADGNERASIEIIAHEVRLLDKQQESGIGFAYSAFSFLLEEIIL